MKLSLKQCRIAENKKMCKTMNIDEKYMREALKEAKRAFEKNEVPIGSVIVKSGKVIARAHNTIEKDNSSLSHAEMKAIKKAQKKIGNWRLNGCVLYSSVEPCIMCISAILLSRIERVVYGCKDKKFGGCESLAEIQNIKGLNHKVEILGGVLEEESVKLMKRFFRKIRKK